MSYDETIRCKGCSVEVKSPKEKTQKRCRKCLLKLQQADYNRKHKKRP